MTQTVDDPTTFRNNIQRKLNLVLDSDAMSINLEKGVFNYALKEAGSRKIIKKWDNPHFVQIYLDRLRSIYVNLMYFCVFEFGIFPNITFILISCYLCPSDY